MLHAPVDPNTGFRLPLPGSRDSRVSHHGTGPQKIAQISSTRRIVSSSPTSSIQMTSPLISPRIFERQMAARKPPWSAGPFYHTGQPHQVATLSYAAPLTPLVSEPRLSSHVQTMSFSSQSSNTSQAPLSPDSFGQSRNSSLAGTPPGMSYGSNPSTLASSTARRCSPRLSQLGSALLESRPCTTPRRAFKVVILNLEPKTTRNEINDLLEQSVQAAYLQYDMKLREINGQIQADVIFNDREIAERVLRNLNGFRHKGRKIMAQHNTP